MAQSSAEKLEHTGPAKKKRWLQCHKESSWQVRKSRLCQKGKELSRLFRAPDRKEGIQRQKSKENSSKGKKKTGVFLCRRTVRVKVKSKKHLDELFENSRKEDVCWGERPEKEGRLVELVGDQIPGSDHLPGAR